MKSLPSKGFTLIETLLILAIIATIIVVSIRVSLQFSQQNRIEQLRPKIDILFNALSHYYQVNCHDTYNSSGQPVPQTGRLSPTSINYPPTRPVAVTIQNLMFGGFLKDWQGDNILVNSQNPYILQFNPIISTRNISSGWYPGELSTKPSPQAIIKQKSVVIWKAQVAIRIRDKANIDRYRGMLGATCISELQSGTVKPCTTQSGTGDYLVWERLPSFASNSAYSSSIATVKAFNQLYTNDDFYAFNYDNATWNTESGYENYLCGG